LQQRVDYPKMRERYHTVNNSPVLKIVNDLFLMILPEIDNLRELKSGADKTSYEQKKKITESP
jgi:hypothetical protein